MGWGDPASWSTTIAELQYALPVYYRKKILELINTPAGLWDKLEIEAFPQRSGTTATFSKYGKVDYTDSVTLTQGANPDPIDLVTGNVTAAIVEKGGVVAIPDLARLSIVDGTKKVSEVVAAWAKEAMEYYVATTLTPYLKQVRDDGDVTYQKNSVSTSSGSTTTIVDTALTEADDFWNGGHLRRIAVCHGFCGILGYINRRCFFTDGSQRCKIPYQYSYWFGGR
jgi:hypothetical protein